MLSVVFQHTHVVKIEYSFLRLDVHDSLAELEELFYLQWLCEVVCNHVICRTVFDFKFIILDPVSYKIISYIYVSGSLGARLLSVVLKEDGRLVILEHYRRVNFISLTIKKVVGLADMRHKIIRSYEFSLGRTSGVELLLGGG